MSDRISPSSASNPRINTPIIAPTNAATSQLAVDATTSTAQIQPQTALPNTVQSVTTEPRIFNQAVPDSPLEIARDLNESERETMSHTAPEVSEQSALENSGSAPATTALSHTAINSQAVFSDSASVVNGSTEIEKDKTLQPEDLVQAEEALDKAALRNFVDQVRIEGLSQFDKVYANSLLHDRDYLKLVQTSDSAEQGDADAQFALAEIYASGRGVKKDIAKAENWYFQAAKQGHAVAMVELGMMYEHGNGVKIDTAYAVTWYQKAANLDNVQAQFRLASMLESGRGVKKDETMALSWYQKAAAQGQRYAQLELAAAYFAGRVVGKDDMLAIYWLLKSSLCDDFVCFDLSRFFGLIELIPRALNEFSEFKHVENIFFLESAIFADEFLSIAKLIRANTPLKAISISFRGIPDNSAKILLQALENNTQLIVLKYEVNLINPTIHAMIMASLAQNVAIAELRQYMKDHPITRSDLLPIEVLDITVDQMIVAYLKSGNTKQATMDAINAFLMSASIESLKEQ